MLGISLLYKKTSVSDTEFSRIAMERPSDAVKGKSFLTWIETRPTGSPGFVSTDKNILLMDGYVLSTSNNKSDSTTPCGAFGPSQVSSILAGYEDKGIAFLTKLNGIFNVVIINRVTEEVVIVNDRYGLLPMYCGQNDKIIAFCPDIMLLAKLLGCRHRVSLQSIADFLNFEFILNNYTFFDNINLIAAGSVTTISSNRDLLHKRYWDYPYETDTSLTLHEAVHHCDTLIEQSMDRVMSLCEKPALLLSGGLDSRTIAGYLNERLDNIVCYNGGYFKGFGDSTFAKMIASQIRAEWRFFDFSDYDFTSYILKALNLNSYHISYNQFWFLPFFTSSRYPTTADAVIDGMCLDAQIGETFSEHTKFTRELRNNEKIDALFRIFLGFPRDLALRLFTKKFQSCLDELSKRRVMESIQHKIDLPISLLSQYYCFVQRVRRYTVGMALINRYNIETIFPFYDYDFFDFVLKLPEIMRRNRKLHKELLLNRFPNLASIPWEKTGLPVGIEPKYFQRKLRNFEMFLNFAIRRLSHGRFEFGQEKFGYDSRLRHDKEFFKFCFDVLRIPTLLDEHLRGSAVEELWRLQLSGRNYAGLLLRLVQIKLFLVEIEKNSSLLNN
jgi:asparagine synthetase B (glutamine-hydrolysing)